MALIGRIESFFTTNLGKPGIRVGGGGGYNGRMGNF